MERLKPHLLLLGLNALAIFFYFFILFTLIDLREIPSNLFFTNDSQEYLGYSKWIAGTADYCNPVRTFFYPFILFVTTNTIGDYGTWIVQFLFWIISCNLTFLSIQRLAQSKLLSAIAFIACCTYIPLIGYSAHALTEITVFFLLTVLLYTIARNAANLKNPNTLLKILFLVSLLAATKPVYQVTWYIAVFAFLLFSFRDLKRPVIILLFLGAMMPVFIQKAIGIATHDTLSSTQIADSNLKKYLYRKTKHYVDNGTISDFNTDGPFHAIELKATENISTQEAIMFLVKHPKETILTFIANLNDNIGAGYPYIDSAKHITIAKWAGFLNKVLMYLHIPVFLTWVFFLWRNRRKYDAQAAFILLSGVLLYYIYLTSGLVFWAGDRLIAPALSAWVCCYLVMGYNLYQTVVKKKI